VNPPLRTEKDVLALRNGLADGTIDIVGTDHAPHPTEDKDCEWQSAAFGMVGLETALSVVVKAMIDTKLMSWSDLVDRMSIAPAKIAGYTSHGQQIKVGSAANLTIIDTNANWIVDRNRLASKSKNTPFEGMQMPSQVVHTFLNGRQVLSNGEIENGGAIE
jgi:dihydroorotase